MSNMDVWTICTPSNYSTTFIYILNNAKRCLMKIWDQY